MDIFEKIEDLLKKGIVIDCVAINQIDNGCQKQVNEGSMPLITYTVEVMNTSLEVLYAESRNSFKDALVAGIKAANKLLQNNITQSKEILPPIGAGNVI
jgi:uncharacterized protein YjgD (DUF1641 family)